MANIFRSLNIRQAIAVQIFYSSPDDENLKGKTLYGENWLDNKGVITGVIFRKTGDKKDEALEKLIFAKAYKKIIAQYDQPKATFKMLVLYKNNKGEVKEMNLINAIKFTESPEEKPKQIMEFLLEKKEYSFLAV